MYLGIAGDLTEGLKKEGLKHGDYTQKAIAIGERVAAENPGNVRYQMDLSATYSALASEQTSLKDFKGALESQRKALTIREGVAAADATDVRANSSLAETLSRLGWTLGRLGDFNEDLKYQNRALQIREKLCAASPENEGLQESLAKSFGNMGKAEERGGENLKFSVAERGRHFRQATLWFEKMQGVYDRLRARSPLSHYAAKDLASCPEWIETCNAKLAKLGSNKSAVFSAPRAESAERSCICTCKVRIFPRSA